MAENLDTIPQAGESRKKSVAGRAIAVAMSGGVDSSTVAALLQRQGARVQGVFMALAQPDLEEQIRRVRAVADFLKIPLTVLDLAEPFRREVVEYFCQSYFAGKTPNPCMVCNRTIKFGLLLDRAREVLGAELLATGHYARISGDETTGCRLLQGIDPQKDQSYFLALLTQAQLGRICFPLGGLRKKDIYGLAAEFGMEFHDIPESQDVCFLKGQSVGDFLACHAPRQPRPGPMLSPEGKELGRHGGIHRYTIGQRRGLGVPDATPWYVVGLDPERNAVLLGKEADLWHREVRLRPVHWQSGRPPALPRMCTVKIRSRQAVCPATLSLDDGGALLVFEQPQRAATPGQFAVFYEGEAVLGCGEIW